MKTRRLPIITSLVLVALLITTGMALADDGPNGQHDDGTNSTLAGNFATVSGGENNKATANHATVGGGGGGFPAFGNTASGVQSTVSGGTGNSATENSATVGGGFANVASEAGATIGGGSHNLASGNHSTIGGGPFNEASGNNATIPGGVNNIAAGASSFAAGRRAKANHDGSFVWADFTAADFASTGGNQFLIRASGGVGIGTNTPRENLVVGRDLGGPLPGNRITVGNTGTGSAGGSGLNLGEGLNQRAFILWNSDANFLQLGVKNGAIQENNGVVVKDNRVGIGTAAPAQRLHVNGNVRANQFLTSSSQRWKTNIQTLEGALEKVQNLRGVSYDWKADGKHDIGLIAEEVGRVIPEVVAYEENGKDAAAVDYAKLVPVLVEAVKEQQQLLEDKDSQIAALKQEKDAEIATLQEDNHKLEARMSTLEESLGTEAKGVQTGLLPFSASLMWMLAGGLGLVLVTPGLVLGYRRIRRDD